MERNGGGGGGVLDPSNEEGIRELPKACRDARPLARTR